MTPPAAATSGPSPQTRTVRELSAGHTWSGSSILRAGGVQAGDPPSWSAATTFTWAYLQAVWKALVAALLISAAVQALVPRGWLLRDYGRVLLRLAVTLVPEYLVVVLLIGAFRGWLLPLGGEAAGPVVLVVLVAAVLGTLMVIPTRGEIPILQGLALAGLSLGPIGALLVTLPALSRPGLVMVIRSFGPRVTAVTTGVIVAGGMLGAALPAAL